MNGNKILICNRENRKGEGLSVVFRNNLEIKLMSHRMFVSFEIAVWKIKLKEMERKISF